MVPRHRPGLVGWMEPSPPDTMSQSLQTRWRCEACPRVWSSVAAQKLLSSSFPAPLSPLQPFPPLLSLPVTQYPCFSICNSLSGVASEPCIHPLNWELPWVHSVAGSCSHQPDLILELFHPLPKPRPVNSPSTSLLLQPSATTNPLSVSADFPSWDISQKWDHVVRFAVTALYPPWNVFKVFHV